MRGPFRPEDDTGWVSLFSTLRDPRVIYRHGEYDVTSIVKPAVELPLTVVVPVQKLDWHLWETIYGLNAQRYENWTVLFVCGDPAIGSDVVSLVKSFRQQLPKTDIFLARKKLVSADILNAALTTVKTDYMCVKAPEDHLHPSALAVMSKAISEQKADFYHTHRFRLNDFNWICCEEPRSVEDVWKGTTFPYRGLYTFSRAAVMRADGFRCGPRCTDPLTYTVYALCNSGTAVYVPAWIYISRYAGWKLARVHDEQGVSLRRELIAENWPQRCV